MKIIVDKEAQQTIHQMADTTLKSQGLSALDLITKLLGSIELQEENNLQTN